MNEYVKMLYDELSGKNIPDNPFETGKCIDKFNSFEKKWIPKTMSQREEAWNELVDLYYSVQENAFAVGFRAAVKLLMNL